VSGCSTSSTGSSSCLLAYIDAFRSLAIIGAVVIPIALAFKTIDLRAPARGH
jgi:DHA2 family multidrug resistance protein